MKFSRTAGCTAYGTALQHYLGGGYTLIVLGDAEELWECRPRPVVDSYTDALLKEAAFHKQQRYVKISGNHDDYWESPSDVLKLLGPLFGPDLIVRKNLRIVFRRGQEPIGELFLVHGHQGDYLSDQAGKIARLFVRYFWRPIQRLTKISLNTPARDFKLSGEQHRHVPLGEAEEGALADRRAYPRTGVRVDEPSREA